MPQQQRLFMYQNTPTCPYGLSDLYQPSIYHLSILCSLHQPITCLSKERSILGYWLGLE